MKQDTKNKVGKIEEFDNGEMEVTVTFTPFEHGHNLGSTRNYNKSLFRDMVNNKEVQMHIKNGYAVGYYSHQNRDLRTLIPSERNSNGDEVFPCCKTISMKYNDDDTVTHTQRILSNDIGKEVQKLIKGGVGGFSGVQNIPKKKFYGFDYVISPNFTTNRVIVDNSCKNGMCGISMDSVSNELENDIQKRIRNYMDSIGVDDENVFKALFNLEKYTDEYSNTLELLGEIEKTKMQKSETLDSIIKSKEILQSEFENFIENRYKPLVAQLDSLGIEVREDNELIPTEKTLGNLFKRSSFTAIQDIQLDNINVVSEILKNNKKSKDKEKLENFIKPNMFGF